MSFILDDHLTWFKSPANSIVDENGTTQMPWVYYSISLRSQRNQNYPYFTTRTKAIEELAYQRVAQRRGKPRA